MIRLLCLCLFAQLAMSARLVKRQTITDQGTHLLVCSQEPMELGIVLDTSASIRRPDFQKGIEFLQDFLDQFEIGPKQVRVSVITFARGVYPREGFGLDKYTDKESLLAAVGNIHHEQGSYTATGEGIEYMATEQLASQFCRPEADRISIVLTDGNSQEGQVTKQAAIEARASGIIIFAIGVGRVQRRELDNIAGNDSRVFQVNSYDELKEIKEQLAYKTCIKKEKPTTTLPPLSACGISDPADINFVFSPADLGPVETSWTTSFIASVIDQEAMEEGFQFGVVSGSCPDDEGFDLDEYDTKREIKARLSGYLSSHIPALVERLVTTSYTAAHGGRPDAKDIAVLVARGGKKSKRLQNEVDNMVSQGIQVFVVDPSGTGINFDGATSLVGKSPREAAINLVNYLCPVRT